MYVVRFDRSGIRWKVTLFEKNWSEEMQTHEVSEVNSHKVFLHATAARWIRNEIAKKLVKQHKLEIING